MSTKDLVWDQMREAVERALCKLRKLAQLDSVTATVEEAAGILEIRRGSAYAAVKDGTIPSVVMNRRLLIPIPSLARMLVEADARAREIEKDGGDA